MNPKPFICVILAWLAAFDPSTLATAQETLTFRQEALVLPNVRRAGRRPLHLDSVIQAWIQNPNFQPTADSQMKTPDGKEVAWTQAEFNGKTVKATSGRGGYVYLQVDIPQACGAVLEGKGYPYVLVNGEWHYGDLYRNNLSVVPLALRQGVNHFVFQRGRGAVSPVLRVPDQPVYLRDVDRTLPDVLAGQRQPVRCAYLIVNATENWQHNLVLDSTCEGGRPINTRCPPLPPFSARKIGFQVNPSVTNESTGTVDCTLLLQDTATEEVIDSVEFKLSVKAPGQGRRITFVSEIDGSVQYYGLQPAQPDAEPESVPGLTLTLHGAGVEAMRQANCYRNKSWVHVVAPTNRRPYGFDWEDWGRLDALEVLAHATALLKPDPRRQYLTGHSMGGHGTWQIGAHFPDRFAAIGPSAGWISFWSYAGAQRVQQADPVEDILRRAASPSDTLELSENYGQLGVYILHGDRDDNVPVDQARRMRDRLGEFHANFNYFEQPGAGHWWGNRCVDWPRMFDFFRYHQRPELESIHQIRFRTASPGVSASCHWVAIEAQQVPHEISSIEIRYDTTDRRFTATTDNIARFSTDIAHLPPGNPLTARVDDQDLTQLTSPAGTQKVWFERRMGQWKIGGLPDKQLKGPHRAGPFKDAFRHRMMLVYATGGTSEENAWAFHKARLDAESFYYRGNGSLDVMPDTDFDAKAAEGRNVILYGNADNHAAWQELLGASPLQVHRGRVQVGDRSWNSDELAVLMVRPKPNSDLNSIGLISGTGLPGMRATVCLPYFVSGIHYPDYIILNSRSWTQGNEAIVAAGFFDQEWKMQLDQDAFHAERAAVDRE